MKTCICFLIMMLSLQAQSKEEAAAGKEISGVVRIIRSQPETEVFFKDLKDSVVIPATSQHNKILEACVDSMKKGTPVKLQIDPISRRALSISTPASVEPVAATDTKSEAPSGDVAK